jgi:hypothetical protein
MKEGKNPIQKANDVGDKEVKASDNDDASLPPKKWIRS